MRAGATVFYSIIQYLWNKGVCFSHKKKRVDVNSKWSVFYEPLFCILSADQLIHQQYAINIFDWHFQDNFSKASNSNMIWCPKRRGNKYNSFAIFHSKSAELLMLYSVFWGLHFLTMTFFFSCCFQDWLSWYSYFVWLNRLKCLVTIIYATAGKKQKYLLSGINVQFVWQIV